MGNFSERGQLDTATGTFVYIPKVSTDLFPALDTDTFQVMADDGHGGTATTTVLVLSNLSAGTTTTSTSAYVENGKVDVPSADTGLLSYSLGTGPSKGTVVVNVDGTYTYTRSLSATGSTTDTFTIIGTDVNGKTVTLPTVSVAPPLVTVTPTTTVSGGTFTPRTMVNGTAILPGTQTTTGTFSGVDAGGHPVTVAGGIYTSALGAVVTVTSGGGFLYSHTTSDDEWHQAAADNAPAGDTVDTVKVNVTDSLGVTSQVTFSIALRTENSAPTSSTAVGSADGLGIVRGSVSGSDNDGDSFTYSLANAGNPSGATTGSTYTANGGVVTLNTDGSFTYIPNKTASTTDSFKVLVSDGHGGTTTATVNVPMSTPSPVANIDTSTAGTVTGKLNVPAGDSGLMTYSVGTGPSKGTVTVNADGTFSYTRTASLGHSTAPEDSFTVMGTEVTSGRTVIIATVNVTPTVANVAPTPGTTTITSSSLQDNRILGIGTLKQTTTGTLHATDADGDAVTYTAGTYSTVNGGTVVINANGTFTYTIDKGYSYYHAAAAVGASGTAIADSFTATVTDAFGGSTTYIVPVSIYAQNDDPSITSGVRGLGNYWTSVFSQTSNGDAVGAISITKQPQHGSATYNSLLQTLSTTGTSNGDTIELTVTETGYYKVVNGVVQVGTLASFTRVFTV